MKKYFIFIRIFIVILIIFFSFLYWSLKSEDFNNKTYAYNESEIRLYLLDDFESYFKVGLKNNYNESNLIVVNDSNEEKKGFLILNYSTLSSLSFDHLDIIINDELYCLSDFYYKSNGNNYLFKIDNFEIKNNNYIKYNIKLKINNTSLASEVIDEYYYINYNLIH